MGSPFLSLLFLLSVLFGVCSSAFSPLNATEINPTVSGILESGESPWFTFSLAAQEVADIVFTFPFERTSFNGYAYFYTEGTDDSYSEYMYLNHASPSPSSFRYSLNSECPTVPAKYFIYFMAYDSNVSYSITVTKRSVADLTGSLRPVGRGVVGIPLTTIGQRYTINIASSSSSLPYWSVDFNCIGTFYEYYCDLAKVPFTTINEMTNGTANNHLLQIVVNSTIIGTVYASTSRDINYTITTMNGYPCPEGCQSSTYGFCDINTGICICQSGYNGTTCNNRIRSLSSSPSSSSPSSPSSSSPSSPSSPLPSSRSSRSRRAPPPPSSSFSPSSPSSEESSPVAPRAVTEVFEVPSEQIVDIPISGDFNFTTTNTTQRTFPFKITNDDFNAWNTIRIVVTFWPSSSQFYLYAQIGSVAHNTNYTINAYAYPTSKPESYEYFVCGGVDSIYITIETGRRPAPMVFSVSRVDASLPSSRSFSGSFFPSPYATLSRYYRPYYFYNNMSQNLYIEASQNMPGLYGVGLTAPGCGFITPVYSQAGSLQGSYQRRTNLAQGHVFGVVMGEIVSSTFTGIFNSTPSSQGACVEKCNTQNGFCSYQTATCKCYLSFTGPTCDEEIEPAGMVQLAGEGESKHYVIQGSISDPDTVRYFSLSVQPGFDVRVEFSTEAGTLWLKTGQNKIPKTYDGEPNNQFSSFSGRYVFTGNQNCANKEVMKYYFLVKAPLSLPGSNFTIRVNTTDFRLPSDGTTVTRTIREQNYVYHLSYLPADCASAYLVEVWSNDGISGTPGVGSYSPTTCNNGYYNLVNVSNVYTAAVPITNCSYPIQINFPLYSISTDFIDISFRITPKPGWCPNDCNSDNGYGSCNIQGTCDCQYPYIGASCGGVAAKCTPVRSTLTNCRSNELSVYNQQFNNYFDTCYIGYEDYNIGQSTEDAVEQYKLDVFCQFEYRQIMCDNQFSQCQSNSDGSTTILLPCNSQTFNRRCSRREPITDIDYVWESVSELITEYPGRYACNPATTRNNTSTLPPSSGVASTTNSSSSLSVSSCLVIAFIALLLLIA